MKFGVRLAVVLAVASFPAAAQADVIAPKVVTPKVVAPTVATPSVTTPQVTPPSTPSPVAPAPAPAPAPASPPTSNPPPDGGGRPYYSWDNPPPPGSPETVPQPTFELLPEDGPYSSKWQDWANRANVPENQAVLAAVRMAGLEEAAEQQALEILDSVLSDMGWGGAQGPQSDKDEYDAKKEQ